MEYAILVASDPDDWDRATPEVRQGYFDAHTAFELELGRRGRKVAGAALQRADTATTLRRDGTGWRVTDGPFAETAEQLTGLYLVDLPDLDAAIAVGRLLPTAYTVEIRPVMEIEGWEPP
jgi:hypothetical protein